MEWRGAPPPPVHAQHLAITSTTQNTPQPTTATDNVPDRDVDAAGSGGGEDEIPAGLGADNNDDAGEEEVPVHRTSSIIGASIQEDGTVLASESSMTQIARRSESTHLITKQEREAFINNDEVSPRVRALINQSFGKENLNQCFQSEACLRLVLLPLWKSNFLDRSCEWSVFASVCREAMCLQSLMSEYIDVDFQPLQGFQPNWETEVTINRERIRWATAALLHFEGDMAALVRWVGGPHVGAHRDVESTLAYLQGKIEPDTWRDVERLYRWGAPAFCNAWASNDNFEEYRKYGNHLPYEQNRAEAERTLVKDNARGYCLIFDRRMVDFTLNCHLTPCGLVNADNPHKKTRPIFDSTFRPKPWCMAINDHTHKRNEPPLHFAASFNTQLDWLYDSRASYPDKEIYPADDDVNGAFRHIKYNPNNTGQHCYQPLDLFAVATGMTFGDNTSPSNFEPLADARRQLAQYLWHQPDTVERAAPYLPDISFAPEPTPAEIATFVQAEPDSIHQGVFTQEGSRRSPPFAHHVDDNLYADVKEHMLRTVSSSILALYHICGFPSPEVPDPLSREKFNGAYTHRRTLLGRQIDTRRMEVGITAEKKEQAIETLRGWLLRKHYTIKDMASLHGTLEDMTRPIKWARPLFFGLQNAIRRALHKRYHVAKREFDRSGRIDDIAKQLPATLSHRLVSMIAIAKARFLWANHIQIDMHKSVRAAIGTILTYLTNPTVQWVQPIGFIVERDPHCVSTGDASELGAGAYSDQLRYWVNVEWSDAVLQGLLRNSSEAGFVHINSLEFIIAVIQLAAAIVRFETWSDASEYAKQFPRGRPSQPILLCRTDNTATKSWMQKVTSTSPQGQQLLGVLAELLRTHVIGLNARHIPGVDNDIADFISRPTHKNLSHSARAEQIFLKHAFLGNYDFFQPSPKLLQLLSSSLFSGPTASLPAIPKKLGRFVPTGSIISCSPML